MNNLFLHTIVSAYIFLTFNWLLFPCPHEFSREDQRPFFEQYDIATEPKNTIPPNNTEQKKETNNDKK